MKTKMTEYLEPRPAVLRFRTMLVVGDEERACAVVVVKLQRDGAGAWLVIEVTPRGQRQLETADLNGVVSENWNRLGEAIAAAQAQINGGN